MPTYRYLSSPGTVEFCAVCYPHHARPHKTCPLAVLCTLPLGEGRCEQHRDVPEEVHKADCPRHRHPAESGRKNLPAIPSGRCECDASPTWDDVMAVGEAWGAWYRGEGPKPGA